MDENPSPAPLDEGSLLQSCPWCGYALRGLPIEHRCPECGQPIDRRWRMFQTSPRWHRAVFWISILMLLGISGEVLWKALVLRRINRIATTGMVFLIAVGGLRKRATCIVVTNESVLVFRSYPRKEERHLLSSIRRAEVDRLGRLVLRLSDQTIRLSEFGFGSSAARSCADYINQICSP